MKSKPLPSAVWNHDKLVWAERRLETEFWKPRRVPRPPDPDHAAGDVLMAQLLSSCETHEKNSCHENLLKLEAYVLSLRELMDRQERRWISLANEIMGKKKTKPKTKPSK
jgi:hypothetical protein